MIRVLTALIFSAFSVAALAVPASAATGTAIFAGGCFWCVESDFDHVPGVTSTISGLIDGTTPNPTYFGEHETYRESVKIDFDTTKTSYEKLLTAYWHSIDPTDAGGAFCDRGHSYTSAIYATNKKQLEEARASKEKIEKQLGQKVATVVKMAPKFYPVEQSEQNFYQTNPLHYKYYRAACGRDRRVKALWGASADEGITPH